MAEQAGFGLPALPYAYNALEPHFDERTLVIHHTKHHQTYIDKLNAALTPETRGLKLEELIVNANKYGPAFRKMGGGHYNHALFWKLLSPSPNTSPQGELKSKIEERWGSFDKFKEDFSNQAGTHFGSGWTWLGVKPDGSLTVSCTTNQDNPLMLGIAEQNYSPIAVIDLWEHAYYLKFQNRRVEYINTFWNVFNWDKVDEFYIKYGKNHKPIPQEELY